MRDAVWRMGLSTLAWLAAACKEPNPDFMPEGSSSGHDSHGGTSSTASSSDAGEQTTIGSSLTLTSSASASETTETATTGTTEVGSSGATDPTTGGGGDPTYPACDAPTPTTCPPGFDECVPVQGGGWCTVHCEDASTCPVPGSGSAEVVCAGPSGNQCALDCSGGASCPDGMGCTHLQGTIYRCIWS